MDTHAPLNSTNPNVENKTDDSILGTKHATIIIVNKCANPGINLSPTREVFKSKNDWQILSIKIVCVLCIIMSLIVAIVPSAGLVKLFLSPKVNASVSVNTQTERLDNKCEVINNSTLGFEGNRSSNLTLVCEFPYTSNGSLCVPVCGTWHPGGVEFGVIARFVTCLAATISLIGCLLGIFTWIKIGKKLFMFPQVIPFYLLIYAAIQALCILIGQIHFEKFYCSEENLIDSRQRPTIQCYIQGAIFHYTFLVFLFWYLIYVVMILLVLSFPFRLRFMNTSSWWKPHIVLFIVATAGPMLILVIFWVVDETYYEVVNHPVVCLPTPNAIFAMFVLPISLMEFLSLSSISLIISQLIIKKFRLHHHKVDLNSLTDEQNQFIIRTLGVTIIFTAINLFLTLEFGTRISNNSIYTAFVEVYWACVTRYGTNTSCCVNNYVEFYNPEVAVINDFFFCSWGLVGISTLGVKEARNFWFELLKKCLCFQRKPTDSHPEVGSRSKKSGN